MCGICGVAGLEDGRLVKKMAEAISHRGPDAEGYYSDKGVSLGHKRLAIIDLSARGKQPMSNEDGSVWVTFNGEIYNFRSLRRFLEKHGRHEFASDSDTEVLVHAYEQWGAEFVSRLRGDFAFGLWDSRNKKLVLARDFPGVCPLYYYHDSRNKRLYFASEIKALLAAGVPRAVNLEAANDFLSLQYSLGPQTLFKDVFKVQPGEMLVFQKGVLTAKRFHSLPQPSAGRKSAGEWIAEVQERFSNSVERRLLSDVPLGVFLSGGLDSSYVAAVMKSLRDEVKTFSVNFGLGSEDEKYSRVVADELGTDHTELSVDASDYRVFPQVAWHMDEPAVDIAALPTFLMAKQAKKYVTVILTGDGGDEVFGGYERYSRLSLLHDWSWAAKRLKLFSSLVNTFSDSPRARELLENSSDGARLLLAYSSALSEREKRVFSTSKLGSRNKTLEKISVFFGMPGSGFLKELMDFDLQTLLPDDYLMKVNKMSMANALEPRVPFLDVDFIAFTQSIPQELKVARLKTKVLFRKVIANSALPKGLSTRRKQGFNVPTREWLSGELGEIAGQMLSDASVRKRGFFSPDFPKRVLENARARESLWGKRFWALFSLEAWQRIYIDPSGIPEKPSSFKDLGV